ncbi:hypothetical protein MPC4_450005 [Methylocella tundrae]|uniref:Uncharacterized protein n=1 Tax=Methylocella tundrae TaxID=227605 RepID=A0A8B6M9R0_METTU|nr:hypothetical protein MPC1_7010001 [Methylocella tundrae]VTZ51664.1 hypothetical protein MPC4_450005 [Methylocella tundrae]
MDYRRRDAAFPHGLPVAYVDGSLTALDCEPVLSGAFEGRPWPAPAAIPPKARILSVWFAIQHRCWLDRIELWPAAP